ncbi:MAG: T9SS type A sorting domain-containing protein [Bacteroidota bacterium]|nr:T9SS type A sorting domain-containing protein [Bacteroidota bacterium]
MPFIFNSKIVFFFLLFISLGFQTTASSGQTRDGVIQKRTIAPVVKKKHSKKRVSRSQVVATKRSRKLNHIVAVKHYPPPGSSGEERDFDWLRKRAFPNEFLDPDYYSNALTEARRLPTFRSYSHSAIQSEMQWQPIGPFAIGGRVTAIATHPTDPNTFYVGAASGGLWKTSDHGNSWQALTDTFASLPIGCITLDPHDANTIYIGMGECNSSGDSYPGNGLWRSNDGGLTWSYLGLSKTQYIAKIIVDPVDKNTIYACVPGPTATGDSNRGIWKSVDYGASWSRSLLVRAGSGKNSAPVPAIDLVMNPTDRGDLIAAMWQHIDFNNTTSPYTGLWRTRDTGKTWYRIDTISSSAYPNGLKLKRLSRTSLLWTVNGKGVPTLYSVISKVDKNPVTGFNFDENFYGLFVTTDPLNVPWQIKLDSNYRLPFLGNNIDSVDLFNKQGGYDNLIIGRPGSDATGKDIELLIGGIDVIRSIDGGTTWTNITRAYPHYFSNDRSQHSDQHALAFTSAKSGTDLLNGQDGGVFNTHDFGASWTQLKGLPITMFYHLETWAAGMANLPGNFPADSLKLIGGTQDNGTVAHGFSANPDWDWINRGDGGQAQTDPNNRDHIVTSLQLGKIFFRTTLDSLRPNLFSDNGNHDPNAKKWFELLTIMQRRGITDSSESCAFIPPVVLDKNRSDELYTGRLHVYRAKLDFTNPDTGTTIQLWSPQIAGNGKAWYNGTIDCIALGVRDGNGRPMLWAGGLLNGSTSLYRTVYDPTISQDSAPRWIKVTTGLPPAFVESIACDRTDSMTAFCGLTGTSSGHVYKTTTGGKKWTNISGNLPNIGVNAIIIDSLAETSDPLTRNQCLIAATDVGVFVTTDGGRSWANLGTGMPHLVVGTITQYKNWLIAGTHGRSAWALDISALHALPLSVEERRTSPDQVAITSIYPNPLQINSGSALHIQVSSQSTGKLGVEIMNAATGALVFGTNLQPLEGSFDLHVPATLSSGSYLLRIQAEEGAVATKQFIIVK